MDRYSLGLINPWDLCMIRMTNLILSPCLSVQPSILPSSFFWSPLSFPLPLSMGRMTDAAVASEKPPKHEEGREATLLLLLLSVHVHEGSNQPF